MSREILVLPAIGDAEGGAPWLEALAGAGQAVVAPDLPGHGGSNPSVDGGYTPGMVLLGAARCLRGERTPVVVGVGGSGWVALVLALAGRASAVAVVDGLGGPWRSAAEATAEGIAWGRRLLDEPDLHAPVPAGAVDPRLADPMPPFSNQRVARQAIAALRVPLLVVSSPSDPLSEAERADLLRAAAVRVTSVTVPSCRAADAAGALLDWMAADGAPVKDEAVPVIQ